MTSSALTVPLGVAMDDIAGDAEAVVPVVTPILPSAMRMAAEAGGNGDRALGSRATNHGDSKGIKPHHGHNTVGDSECDAQSCTNHMRNEPWLTHHRHGNSKIGSGKQEN